jgi:hypothetical protein
MKGLSEISPKTSPPPPLGDGWTTAKILSKLAGARPKKVSNNGVFTIN